MKNPNPSSLKLEEQYQFYLKMVCLEESKMSETQKTETRRAFYGACGQILILARDVISEMEERPAIETFQDLLKQVSVFWEKEISK